MSSDDLWFLTRWLDNMAIVHREDKSENNNKRKRSGTGESMASDSGYTEDAVGELKIPTTKTSKKEKLQDEFMI